MEVLVLQSVAHRKQFIIVEVENPLWKSAYFALWQHLQLVSSLCWPATPAEPHSRSDGAQMHFHACPRSNKRWSRRAAPSASPPPSTTSETPDVTTAVATQVVDETPTFSYEESGYNYDDRCEVPRHLQGRCKFHELPSDQSPEYEPDESRRASDSDSHASTLNVSAPKPIDFDGTLLEHSIQWHLDQTADANLSVDWNEDASLGYINMFERESMQLARDVVPKCSIQSAATPSITAQGTTQSPSIRAAASPQKSASCYEPDLSHVPTPSRAASMESQRPEVRADTAAYPQ